MIDMPDEDREHYAHEVYRLASTLHVETRNPGEGFVLVAAALLQVRDAIDRLAAAQGAAKTEKP